MVLWFPPAPSSSSDTLVTPQPVVRVCWRPEQYNRVTNGTFETNTSGWSVSAGVNAAGTSVTRVTTDSHSGSACAEVVTTTTIDSGVHWDFGSDVFYREATRGTMYQVTVWLKRVSGGHAASIILGSEGTTADRVTLDIPDLVDAWRPYTVRWLPTSDHSDVQLAVTTGDRQAVTFRMDDVSVCLVDTLSQVENGTFETDTAGWTTNGAATITRTTGDAFAGDGYAQIVTDTTAYTGAAYSLGTRAFISGRTYRLWFAARAVSGSAVINVGLGDFGASDDAASTPTLTSSWAVYTLDWTPSADRTAVSLTLYNNAAATNTFEVDEVEVFEALDDITTDVDRLAWARAPRTVSPISVSVLNDTGKYDARNTSGSLYGALLPGRRVLGRATYGNALYPLFHGTIRSIEVMEWEGRAQLNGEDTWSDFTRADFAADFAADRSYAEARAAAVAAVVSTDPDTTASVGGSRYDLATGGIEGNTFFDGTDGPDSAASYLSELDDATQSLSWCEPQTSAVIGWRYVTRDRATLTSTLSDVSVDEDMEDLTGVLVSADTLENRQVIPWQGYELLAPPEADPTGYGVIAQAIDPDTYATTDPDAPYLTFTDDEYGTDDDHPELRFRYPRGWTAKRWQRRRRKGHKVPRRTRIYPQSFVPLSVSDTVRPTIVVDLAIPMADLTVTTDVIGTDALILDKRPLRLEVEFYAATALSILEVLIYGRPYMPGDDLDAIVDGYDSQSSIGVWPGPTLSTPYIPSRAAAEGIGSYRNWRYSTPRLQPTLVDHNAFPRTLTATVADHFTLSADRWSIDALLFVSTGCRWEVTNKAMEWRAWHDLEELPTHSTWFTLGSSLLGGADVLAP